MKPRAWPWSIDDDWMRIDDQRRVTIRASAGLYSPDRTYYGTVLANTRAVTPPDSVRVGAGQCQWLPVPGLVTGTRAVTGSGGTRPVDRACPPRSRLH